MTNPTTPWELQQLDPDTDAPKLMQDFNAILEWAQFEAIHVHHVQKFTFSLTTIAGGGFQDFNFTFTPPFNATPICTTGVQTSTGGGSPPANCARTMAEVFNLDGTGGSIRFYNDGATALGAGHIGTMVAFDATYDTST